MTVIPLGVYEKVTVILQRLGGYFFIAIMVYRTIIRIKVMYSTASPPPKKEGAKSITPSGIKRGKTANRMATPVCILPDHSSGRNIRTEKRQDFLPLFCVERHRFGEDISNPCRRHTETLHYSLFTLHFYHPKLCEGEKPRHTSTVPGIARESPPQAEPGRSSRA